jgi:hypothetical protein
MYQWGRNNAMGVLTGAKSLLSSVLWSTAFAASGLSALGAALDSGGDVVVSVGTPSPVIRFVNASVAVWCCCY